MALSLSHIAEPVFAALVNRRPEAFLEYCGLLAQADIDFVRRTPAIALCEVPLAPLGNRLFDGASRADAVVRLGSDLATAFEFKLGHTRLSKTRFDSEWLLPCKPSHGGSRWSGSVMAALDRRFPEVQPDLFVTIDGARSRLTSTWFLVVRKSVQAGWGGARPSFSSHARILQFEDMVAILGGKAVFNEVVRGLVDFDFFSEWRLS